MNPTDLEATMLRAMAAADGKQNVPTLAERAADADAAARERVGSEAELRKAISVHDALAERLHAAEETLSTREHDADDADAKASASIATGVSDADADKALRNVETMRRNAQIPARVIAALAPELQAASAAINAARKYVSATESNYWRTHAGVLEARVWIEAAPLLAELADARFRAFRVATLPDTTTLARHAEAALREATEAAAA